MLAAWADAGFSPFGFWDLTLWEFDAAMTGARRRIERDHQAQAWAVWHIAALSRVDRLPDFNSFARPAAPRGPQGRDELQHNFDLLSAIWGAST